MARIMDGRTDRTWTDGWTDGLTNRLTYGPTDSVTYRVASTRLKLQSDLFLRLWFDVPFELWVESQSCHKKKKKKNKNKNETFDCFFSDHVFSYSDKFF